MDVSNFNLTRKYLLNILFIKYPYLLPEIYIFSQVNHGNLNESFKFFIPFMYKFQNGEQSMIIMLTK
jgi:hypothetical protein